MRHTDTSRRARPHAQAHFRPAVSAGTAREPPRLVAAAPPPHGRAATRPWSAAPRAGSQRDEVSKSGAADPAEACTLTSFGGLPLSSLFTRSAEAAPPSPASGGRPEGRPAAGRPRTGGPGQHRRRQYDGLRDSVATSSTAHEPAIQLSRTHVSHTSPNARANSRPRPLQKQDFAFSNPTARWERLNPFGAVEPAAPVATAAPAPVPGRPSAPPSPYGTGTERSGNVFDNALGMGSPPVMPPPPGGGDIPPAYARRSPRRAEWRSRGRTSPPRATDAESTALSSVAREGALSPPGPRRNQQQTHDKQNVRRALYASAPQQQGLRDLAPPRGSALPSFSSPLSRGRESLDARVRRLTSECGLDVPLCGAQEDRFTATADGSNIALVERLDNAAATRVHEAADRERLSTALTWFLGFLRDTERIPFVDPDAPGGSGYNQKTLELFAEYIRLKGSKRPGHRGTQLNSDTIAAYVGAVKLAASRIQRRPLVSKDDNVRLPMQMKQMRREQAPPGSSHNGVGTAGGGDTCGRALCRALRAHHLREISQNPALDRTSRSGIQDWAAALLAHNLLLRGGELGRSSKGRWDPRRGLTLESLDFREPCPESEGCPWVIVRMVAIKDTNARHAPVFIPIRRRASFLAAPVDSDPLDAYDAIRRAWLARRAEVPPHMRHEAPLFTSSEGGSMAAWTTDDSRRLARDFGRMVNIAAIDIGGKAFRVGGATDMRDALGDASIHLIKQRGRWASDVAQVYQRALVRSHLEASVLMSSKGAASRDMEELVKGWAQPAICM